MSEVIKKYPIYYNNEEYEIRIEKEEIFAPMGLFYDMHVNIYEVNVCTFYLLDYPVKDKKEYNKVYSTELDYLKQKLYISEDSDDYYIELFKLAFKQYIKPLEAKKRQLAALENWDGVIS